jgi:hypothetical protein
MMRHSPRRCPFENTALSDRRILLGQIASGNLDIAVIGQLPPPQLPLDD